MILFSLILPAGLDVLLIFFAFGLGWFLRGRKAGLQRAAEAATAAARAAMQTTRPPVQ
jgi:hypothetical protein